MAGDGHIHVAVPRPLFHIAKPPHLGEELVLGADIAEVVPGQAGEALNKTVTGNIQKTGFAFLFLNMAFFFHYVTL